MFEFREIKLSDKEWINKCLEVSDFMGCEYSFANNIAWRRLSNTLICLYEDFYISCSYDDENKPYFTFPTGVKTDIEGIEKYKRLFLELKTYSEKKNAKLKISSVNKENLKWIKDYYKDRVIVSENRDYFDYIYKTNDLIDLSGKKFHGKRNHIKRFKDTDWSFELLNENTFDECIAFAAEAYNDKNSHEDYSSVVEQYAINMFFDDFKYLGLKGGILRKERKIVGFTIGEKLNSNTFVVHIEKADSSVQGSYPTLCNEFLKACATDCEYVNREEDLGIEGLRKSKLSYHPDFLLEKYVVEFK